jgi:osmotically-inducible protein OsmY
MTCTAQLLAPEGELEAPSSRERPSLWLSNADDDLCDAVCYRLSENDEVDASGVQVRAIAGEITLEGRVETFQECQLVAAIAATVPDVKRVHNAIQHP